MNELEEEKDIAAEQSIKFLEERDKNKSFK